ncbi:hypothetical protein [Thiorhodovibrio frisius]|uniref:Uncharacterized protein n=1 Tax=Thiorhodovibrio frisius TaxID=631362 RepID=H8YWQ7_9GAMM|nr:hypothetical protein [Thiorhodovibrio frisius]EIC22883.1 hypothetical protein Thi970DRAFT_00522 [Thiorhodovibrio frisius]WPL22857.1 hypothetical protein Thiofri_03034 [Thiorhodovibrio frisius]
MKRLTMAVGLLTLGLATGAFGNAQEYCEGYKAGYKAGRGRNDVAVPTCPAAPTTPAGSTPYQEGLKAGMKAGSKDK